MRASPLLALLAACAAEVGDPPPPPEPGFRIETFADYRTLVSPTVEPAVALAWDDADDFFSVRVTATLEVPAAGVYDVATVADDGVRLWIDDQLVIDDWRPHFP